MQKDFDNWNNIKKLIDKKEIRRDVFFYEREIWWCSAGINIGIEIDGKHKSYERPFLIIKKFNSQMLWVLPLTTQNKFNKYYYNININHQNTSICLSQLKTISSKRLLRKISVITNNDFNKIIKSVCLFLNKKTNTAHKDGILGGRSH